MGKWIMLFVVLIIIVLVVVLWQAGVFDNLSRQIISYGYAFDTSSECVIGIKIR